MKVFLSSTYSDLYEHRRRLIEFIDRLRHNGADLEWLGMEAFGARDDLPVDACVKFVDACDLYLGVFGVRYGSRDRTSGLSMTEVEYRRAVEKNKSRLIFLIDQANAKVAPKDFEDSGEGKRRLKGLVAELREDRVTDSFTTPEDLASKVVTAIMMHDHKMSEDIARRDRLEALGQLTAGIAHEIRNPLASVRSFLRLLPERKNDPEFIRSFIGVASRDVDRVYGIVNAMLRFGRPAKADVKEHSAKELVDEALLLLHPQLKEKRIKVVRNLKRSVILKANKPEIEQVLVNLVWNAIEAVPVSGKIVIRTGICRRNNSKSKGGIDRLGLIEISDNGPGIPASIRGRVFDPFFTTKGDGTGLGLSVSLGIVRDHGGTITVSSAEGKGTTFQVCLPLAAIAV